MHIDIYALYVWIKMFSWFSKNQGGTKTIAYLLSACHQAVPSFMCGCTLVRRVLGSTRRRCYLQFNTLPIVQSTHFLTLQTWVLMVHMYVPNKANKSPNSLCYTLNAKQPVPCLYYTQYYTVLCDTYLITGNFGGGFNCSVNYQIKNLCQVI